MVQAAICKYIILPDTDRKKGDLQYPHPNVVHREEGWSGFCLCHGLTRSHAGTEVRLWEWSEPLKWHTKLGTVSGKGNTRGEKEILPEISANGCRTDGDLRRCR